MPNPPEPATPNAAAPNAGTLQMLRRKADFEALGRQGKARSNRLLVLRSLRTGRSETRIGLSTPRKLGGAVQRNLVRRRLRELLREQLRQRPGTMGAGWDLLLIARPEAATASHAQLRESLVSLLERSGIEGTGEPTPRIGE